jgi:uncharacterized protein YndB with AHSA1/START domain
MFEPIEATVTLAAPGSRQAVWAALTDASRWPEALPDLGEGRISPDGVVAAGARIETRAKADTNVIDMTYRIVAADPPRRLVLESDANGFRALVEYRIEGGDGAGKETAVIVSAKVTPLNMGLRLSVAFRRAQYVTQVQQSLRRRTAALLTLAKN